MESSLFKFFKFITQNLYSASEIFSTFKDKKNIILKLLDDHYKSFVYKYKAYSTNNIIKFDIKNINTIQNQVIWDLFVINGLFFFSFIERIKPFTYILIDKKS